MVFLLQLFAGRCVFQSLNQVAVQAGATVFFFGAALRLLHRHAGDIERGLQHRAELRGIWSMLPGSNRVSFTCAGCEKS